MAGISPPGGALDLAAVDDLITANGSSGRELEADGDVNVFGPLTPASTTTICTLEFTVGARPVLVEFDLPVVYDDDPCAVIAQIVDADTTGVLHGRCISAPGGGILAGSSGTAKLVFRVPGDYSILGTVYASTGTPIIGYDSTTEATLRAIEQ